MTNEDNLWKMDFEINLWLLISKKLNVTIPWCCFKYTDGWIFLKYICIIKNQKEQCPYKPLSSKHLKNISVSIAIALFQPMISRYYWKTVPSEWKYIYDSKTFNLHSLTNVHIVKCLTHFSVSSQVPPSTIWLRMFIMSCSMSCCSLWQYNILWVNNIFPYWLCNKWTLN